MKQMLLKVVEALCPCYSRLVIIVHWSVVIFYIK